MDAPLPHITTLPRVQRMALRIAVLAPPWIAVPPPGYGGIEAVVALLCDELVARDTTSPCLPPRLALVRPHPLPA